MRSGVTRMVDTGRFDRSRPGAGRGSHVPPPGRTIAVGVALLFGAVAALPNAAAEKLPIATTGDHPPFSRVDDNGEVGGFDVEIALALCAESPRSARPFSTRETG